MLRGLPRKAGLGALKTRLRGPGRETGRPEEPEQKDVQLSETHESLGMRQRSLWTKDRPPESLSKARHSY